jgi:hypothetical protein
LQKQEVAEECADSEVIQGHGRSEITERMGVNPLSVKKSTAGAVPEKSKKQTRKNHDVEPGGAIDGVVLPGPLPEDVVSNDCRGDEETAQHEKHDHRLVAKPGEKIEGSPRPGFAGGMLDVHKKKGSQMAKHHGASGDRANQVEGVGGGSGKLARHPGRRNWRRRFASRLGLRLGCWCIHKGRCTARCEGLESDRIGVWSMAGLSVSTSDFGRLPEVRLNSVKYFILCKINGYRQGV